MTVADKRYNSQRWRRVRRRVLQRDMYRCWITGAGFGASDLLIAQLVDTNRTDAVHGDTVEIGSFPSSPAWPLRGSTPR
jgi:5-methylcytosine-specific restriction endonuclease McrA